MPLPKTPHALPVQAIQDLLSTSPAGLTETEANVRLKDYGRNVLKEEKTSNLVIFLRQFKSILIYILIIAAIISLIVADIKDFLIIILIISINSVIGFWQELKAADRTAEEILEDPDQDGYGIGLLWWGRRGPEERS
jgi:Ca2+-transporting ATPase